MRPIDLNTDENVHKPNPAEETPLRSDVPLDLHPDSLLGVREVLDIPDTLGRRALSAAREALVVAHRNYAQFNDIEASLFAVAGSESFRVRAELQHQFGVEPEVLQLRRERTPGEPGGER